MILAASGVEAQILPYSGGSMEQPAYLMDAVSAYSAESSRLRDHDRRRREREAHRSAKSKAGKRPARSRRARR